MPRPQTVALIVQSSGILCLSSATLAQHGYSYTPGSFLRDVGYQGFEQINPDGWTSGYLSMIGVYSWGTYPHRVREILPPPHVFDYPDVPDVVISRVHQTPVTLRNETSCDTEPKFAAFSVTSATSVAVTSTESQGWSLSLVVRWSLPLVQGINTGVTYTQNSSTSWTYTDTTSLTASINHDYLVDSCHKRKVWMIIEESTRTQETDYFTAVEYYEGHMMGPNGVTRPDANGNNYIPHFLGRLETISGSATWISNFDTEPDAQQWVSDCDINCGGVSDGDIDDDDIPDDQDDDMDGDGITNDHDDDIDGDGIPNDADPDDDNDGILDEHDTFNGPPGSDDIDGDGIDNEDDDDIDGDGIPNQFETGDDDDLDGDGIPNKDDADIDGDGIPNEEDDSPYGSVPTIDVWIDGIYHKVPLIPV